jgi:hypothetical protein
MIKYWGMKAQKNYGRTLFNARAGYESQSGLTLKNINHVDRFPSGMENVGTSHSCIARLQGNSLQ